MEDNLSFYVQYCKFVLRTVERVRTDEVIGGVDAAAIS